MRIFGLGPTELMIILAILLLLFGPKQIPKLSRMFGKAMKDVKDGIEGKLDEDETPAEIPAAKTPSADAAEKKTDESVS